jgi:hypothetical protein
LSDRSHFDEEDARRSYKAKPLALYDSPTARYDDDHNGNALPRYGSVRVITRERLSTGKKPRERSHYSTDRQMLRSET